jgi:hypothetical protein
MFLENIKNSYDSVIKKTIQKIKYIQKRRYKNSKIKKQGDDQPPQSLGKYKFQPQWKEKTLQMTT